MSYFDESSQEIGWSARTEKSDNLQEQTILTVGKNLPF